jgi:hypothetical protein
LDGRDPAEQKRAVCSSMASVLRASPLSQHVDPRQFLLSLTASWPALCPDGRRLDLGPLWGSLQALVPGGDPDALLALFLKWGEVTARTGLEVAQPPAVQALPEDARLSHLRRFPPVVPRGDSILHELGAPGPGSGPQRPISGGGMPRPSTSGMPAPATGGMPAPAGGMPAPATGGMPAPSGDTFRSPFNPSSSGGMPAMTEPVRPGSDPRARNLPPRASTIAKPILEVTRTPGKTSDPGLQAPPQVLPASALVEIPGEERTQRIVSALTAALRATPAGPKIQVGQLQFFVTTRFAELCDGKRFDFAPILAVLLEIEGVTEADVYIGIVRFRSLLLSMGVEMDELPLTLDQTTREAIVSAARTTADAELRAVSTVGADVGRLTGEAPRPSSEGHRDKLAEYGLSNPKKGLGKHAKYIRVAGLAALLAGAVAALVLLDPVETLDAGRYKAALPMVSAQMAEGYFVGKLDQGAWDAMTPAQRKAAAKKLEGLLRSEGRLAKVAVMSADGRRVVFDVKGERLDVALDQLDSPPPPDQVQ